MGPNYRMICDTNLVFQGLPTTLYDLVNEGRYEELNEVLKNLRVCDSSSFEHCTEQEIRRFNRVLISNKKHSLIKEYMPLIQKALVEAEDYNALLMIRDHPKLYGELSSEGVAVIEKYAAARERTKAVFAIHAAKNGEADFDEVEGDLIIKFRGRTLTFQFGDGRAYKVFRFDS